MVVFFWTHYYPSWPNYCKGVRGKVGQLGMHSMIQTLFSNDAIFQDGSAPIDTAGTVQS
jgi:hypothetical protein